MALKIRYEKQKCIGSAACEAVAPNHFYVDDTRKAVLKGGSETEDDVFEKEISEDEVEEAKMAVMGCPPNCIKLLKDGEEVDE